MMDSTNNLGYSYYMPKSGLLRLRSYLCHNCCYIFGVFDRYLAPAYHHDRCERSVQMNLYTLHKREFVFIFIGLFVSLGLLTFIGLVGPPITWTDETLATNLSNVSEKNMATGPFVVPSPSLNSYHQQVWIMSRIDTKHRDDEAFEKSFSLSLNLFGVSRDTGQILKVFNEPTERDRRLTCPATGDCEPIMLLHLSYVDFPKYYLILKFNGLEGVHERYHIKDIHFYFKTYNPSFTQLEMCFRFIYCLSTFGITCWFMFTLRKYLVSDWSIEQRWMSILLPLLFLYNNPGFPHMFLINSTFPGMLDAVFQVTFLSGLFLFWLSIYHGLRQVERRLVSFYLPKLLLVGSLWFSAITLACWQKLNYANRDPTYNYEMDTQKFNNLKTFFTICGIIYVIDLIYLVFKAYSELRSMPYFDLRLKFLTALMLLVMKISMVVTYMRFGMDILEDHFVADLSTKYSSSAEFMSFYGLLNLYIYTMVYVYAPSSTATINSSSQITKDNPSFSMVNDSDEDVIYGSEEDDSKTPLNHLSHNGQPPQDDSD